MPAWLFFSVACVVLPVGVLFFVFGDEKAPASRRAAARAAAAPSSSPPATHAAATSAWLTTSGATRALGISSNKTESEAVCAPPRRSSELSTKLNMLAARPRAAETARSTGPVAFFAREHFAGGAKRWAARRSASSSPLARRTHAARNPGFVARGSSHFASAMSTPNRASTSSPPKCSGASTARCASSISESDWHDCGARRPFSGCSACGALVAATGAARGRPSRLKPTPRVDAHGHLVDARSVAARIGSGVPAVLSEGVRLLGRVSGGFSCESKEAPLSRARDGRRTPFPFEAIPIYLPCVSPPPNRIVVFACRATLIHS